MIWTMPRGRAATILMTAATLAAMSVSAGVAREAASTSDALIQGSTHEEIQAMDLHARIARHRAAFAQNSENEEGAQASASASASASSSSTSGTGKGQGCNSRASSTASVTVDGKTVTDHDEDHAQGDNGECSASAAASATSRDD